MLRQDGCVTCKYSSPCHAHNKCKSEPPCPMYSEEQLEQRLDGFDGCYTHCKCLSIDDDEECPYYEEE